MSEIKIGEHVRTKEGYIAKVLENKDELICDNVVQKEFGDTQMYICEVDIDKVVAKHSKSLINLIEKGDIVNNYYIKELIILHDGKTISICVYKDKDSMICLTLKEEDIKTILTHEMYEKNYYKVEE